MGSDVICMRARRATRRPAWAAKAQAQARTFSISLTARGNAAEVSLTCSRSFHVAKLQPPGLLAKGPGLLALKLS